MFWQRFDLLKPKLAECSILAPLLHEFAAHRQDCVVVLQCCGCNLPQFALAERSVNQPSFADHALADNALAESDLVLVLPLNL